MASEKLQSALIKALELKELARSGWVRAGVPRPESVAAHSWGVAWLALTLGSADFAEKAQLSPLQSQRLLQLALVHDLGEIIVGDLTPSDNIDKSQKHHLEEEAVKELTKDLPNAPELVALFREYAENKSPEAKFVHALDKLDMALQAQRYEQLSPQKNLQEFVDSALQELADSPLESLAKRPRSSQK